MTDDQEFLCRKDMTIAQVAHAARPMGCDDVKVFVSAIMVSTGGKYPPGLIAEKFSEVEK